MKPTPKRKSYRFKRLLRHLEYINETEPEVFDLKTFVNVNRHSNFRILWPVALKAKKPLNCGTTACIIGHMPLIFEEFRWQGGHVEDHDGNTAREWSCADFFGGHHDAWHNIIYSSNYASEHPPLSDVLKRLHKLYADLYTKP